jgi:hypothetical protein
MLQDVPNFAKGRGCVKDITKKNIVLVNLVVMRGVRDKVVKEGYVCFMVLFQNCLANIRDVPTVELGVNKDFVGDMAQRRDKEASEITSLGRGIHRGRTSADSRTRSLITAATWNHLLSHRIASYCLLLAMLGMYFGRNLFRDGSQELLSKS